MKPETHEPTITDKKPDNEYIQTITELKNAVFTALKTYSNVDRGSGHYSQITTTLLQKAREIVLEYLKVDKRIYVVIFGTTYGIDTITNKIKSPDYQLLSSEDIGLPLGLHALVLKKKSLPNGLPTITGGGMIKLVSPNSLVLADVPERFEAGTPSILSIIAFAKALQMADESGSCIFKNKTEIIDNESHTKIFLHDKLMNYTGRELLLELRKSMPDRFFNIPTLNGEKSYTNLDNAASTPAFMPVWETVCQTWRQPLAVQHKIVDEVKKMCAGFLDAPFPEYDLIFCSNTTEAINIAAKNFVLEVENGTEPVVLNTLLEHHSNDLPWRNLAPSSLIRLEVNDEGFIDLKELERIIKEYNQEHFYGRKRVRLVTVCGASNVLGSYNDLKTIARIAHNYNARILVDAAQLVAHRKIYMKENEIDYLAFSGHKMYAPFGSGALVVRKNLLKFNSVELKKIKASGEGNVSGIAAIGKAINLLQRIGMDIIKYEEYDLTSYALHGLTKIPGITIFGVQNLNSSHFLNKGGIITFTLKGVPHNLVAKELAEEGGIGVRTGCFCSHLISKQLMHIHPIRSYLAEVILNYTPLKITGILPGLVRISLGLENDEKDVDHLIRVMQKIASKRRSYINRLIASLHNGTPFLNKNKIQKKIEKFTDVTIEKVFTQNKPQLIKTWYSKKFALISKIFS